MRLRTLILALSMYSLPAMAGSLSLSSGDDKVGLLELYTSEGCSSCPPADRWVTGLKDNPGLWSDFVPVAFHVDYWDYIGWKDRFASSEYTQRQRTHAREQGMRTIYTPGFFYNGSEWRRRSSSPGKDFSSDQKVGDLTLQIDGRQAEVQFAPHMQPDSELQANIVLLGFDVSTAVRAGENTGRKLEHDFVVLGVEQMTMTSRDGQYLATLQLPASAENAPRYGVAAWINQTEMQRPIQAVGGWLPSLN